MGDSSSEKINTTKRMQKSLIPEDFGHFDENGNPLTKKGLKAMHEIRKMLEKAQPMESWFNQIRQVTNKIECKRFQAIASPAVHHATRLQRKLRASPRSTVRQRSVSCPERLSIFSSREYIEKMNLKLSRTKSIVDIEVGSWFGMNVDDLVQKVYMKYLAVDPFLDDWCDSDDESDTDEIEVLKTLGDTSLRSSEGGNCGCCHLGHSEEDVDPIRDKFIEETVSQALEIRKLIEEQSVKGKKHASGKIKESVKNMVQHVTEHFFQRRNEKQRLDRLEAEKTLQSVKERILPYSGRESNWAFFNKVYIDFLNHTDRCDCQFMKDGRGVEKATAREVALHVDHRLRAEETVNSLFIQLIRESPEDLKECPIEMQIVYQFMFKKVTSGTNLANVLPKEAVKMKHAEETAKLLKNMIPGNFSRFEIQTDDLKMFPEHEISDIKKVGNLGRTAF